MTDYDEEEYRRDLDEDARIWRERRLEVQSRVTPEDFAFFLRQLEQIEAWLVDRPGRWEPRAQTPTKARSASNATSKHDQAAAQQVEMVLGHQSRNRQ